MKVKINLEIFKYLLYLPFPTRETESRETERPL